MKRTLLALSLAVFAQAALAAGSAPFEQTQLDRELPNVQNPVIEQSASAGSSVLTAGAGLASGPWANDHNFIAPPQ